MLRKNKRRYDDDGRTIADMNVDGMPWYNPNIKKSEGEGEQKPEPISKRETASWLINGILAALFIGLLFVGAAWLFIMFCTNIWLK